MKLSERTFHRLFSINLYKNKRLQLGEMSFFKDFTRETRGDPYPVLSRAGHIRAGNDRSSVINMITGVYDDEKDCLQQAGQG